MRSKYWSDLKELGYEGVVNFTKNKDRLKNVNMICDDIRKVYQPPVLYKVANTNLETLLGTFNLTS